MSQWAQAFGALGAVVMAAFGGANWRFPFLERYRMAGLGLGMLTWVLGRFDAPAGGPPGWYETAGSCAMVIAGGAGLVRSSQRHRGKSDDSGDEGGRDDDGPLNAAEGDALVRHYFKWDSTASLDSAVDKYRAAVRATAGTPARLRHEAQLLKTLRIRYERLRDRACLDEAVRLGRRARPDPGPRSHRALLLAELSTALRLRHDDTGDSDDLTEARECGGAAVALLHPRHLLFPLCSSRLGSVLLSSYEHTGDPRHLDDALNHLRRGLDSAAERGYTRTADEIRLCFLLTERGRRAGSRDDLAEAVELGRRVLDRIAPGDALYPSCLHHVSVAVRAAHAEAEAERGPGRWPPADRPYRTYRITGPGPGLEWAENLAREALLRLADEDPEQARHLLNHALVLHALHRARPAPGLLDQALAAARTAARHPTADLPTRVRAGLAWGDIAAAENRHPEAVDAFECVIELLPRLASHELARADQEEQIARWPGVAVAAATSALKAGQPDRAAVLLEHGRGMLLSRTLALRTDATAMRVAHPRLAAELEETRRELTAPVRDSDPEVRRRTRRAQEERWEQLLGRINGLPGFGDFAGPPTAERLRAQGAHGPLIYLTATGRGSGAIVVTAEDIRAVPLDVTPEDVERRVRVLHSCFAPGAIHRADAQGPAFGVLGWMWDELVAPALSVALPPVAPGGPLPRVWWVPTGMFTALPLHAAGHHREGGPALLDRAVSSYTPTVRALAAARSQSGATVPGGSRLVVSVPSAPNAPALLSAAEEAELVRAAAPGATTLLTDAAATRDRVLAELPRHSWAHFACHAAPDPRAPSRSGLLLQDHARGALTVADVSALDLRGSRLAYLSACETAAVGPRHVDEAIHLASAFQLAGFSHVISTLWQLPDRAAFRLAQAMYTEFSEAGQDGGEVAGVVHAVNRLGRDTMFPKLPGVWAAPVHVGP
ncbi:CHAT domain-containing protein [Streptomyces sp. NBC_01725]|uniref:CHAT domain-containing protein n=1 Tax=Streptomyces sp. NBC_01725 TaxID=2975923 RepID=UPI002E28777C|nr:CHAT domain-containing protein [Streptomyces sp. NBC_01725]